MNMKEEIQYLTSKKTFLMKAKLRGNMLILRLGYHKMKLNETYLEKQLHS